VYIQKGGEDPLWTDVQWKMVLERMVILIILFRESDLITMRSSTIFH
jgi:hypothetical protein